MTETPNAYVQTLGDYWFHIKDVLYIKGDDESVIVGFHNGTKITITAFNRIELDSLKADYLKFHGWVGEWKSDLT